MSFNARTCLKRRIAPYKGIHHVYLLETDFKHIFGKFWQDHGIPWPEGQFNEGNVIEAIDKLLKVATKEECQEMIYRLDEYQIAKRLGI